MEDDMDNRPVKLVVRLSEGEQAAISCWVEQEMFCSAEEFARFALWRTIATAFVRPGTIDADARYFRELEAVKGSAVEQLVRDIVGVEQAPRTTPENGVCKSTYESTYESTYGTT